MIKGSSEDPFWEHKIKTMLLSHLLQRHSRLMWPHYLAAHHKINTAWLSLDDKLKDGLVTSQSAYDICPIEHLAKDNISPELNIFKYIK